MRLDCSTVFGQRTPTGFQIMVPSSFVGGPSTGALLEGVTGYTALDNGLPPEIGPGAGNIPSVTDATPAYNVALSTTTTTSTKKHPTVA